MMFEDLHVTLSPQLSAVRNLSRMVEAFGAANQLPESKIYMVNLALDELITNAVTYGFDGIACPKIEITVRVTDTALGPDDGGQRDEVRSHGRHAPRCVVRDRGAGCGRPGVAPGQDIRRPRELRVSWTAGTG